MSSEAPPQPVSTAFNVSQWKILSTGKDRAWVTTNFLSKVIADVAQGIISFVSGIKTNIITVYTGIVLTIGETGKTVNLWYPTLASPNPTDTDTSTKISSTSWVGSWFNYKRLNEDIDWVVAQSFRAGIKTNKITFYTGSTVTIGTVDSTATNLYSPKLLSTASLLRATSLFTS